MKKIESHESQKLLGSDKSPKDDNFQSHSEEATFLSSAKKFIFGNVWKVIVATLGVIFLLIMLYGFESVIEKKKSFIPRGKKIFSSEPLDPLNIKRFGHPNL